MTNEEYHAHPAIGHSMLETLIRRGAAAYQHEWILGNRPSPTPAMLLGTAVHELALEGELKSAFLAPKTDRRTKAGKATYEKIQREIGLGRRPVDPAEYDKICRMAASVADHPTFREAIESSDATVETTVLGGVHEVEVKCRPDLYVPGRRHINLKTASDATPTGFARAAANLGYHRGQVHYGAILGDVRHIYVVVASSPPYECAAYEIGSDLSRAEEQWRDALLEIRGRMAADDWTDPQAEGIQKIDLPRWS